MNTAVYLYTGLFTTLIKKELWNKNGIFSETEGVLIIQ